MMKTPDLTNELNQWLQQRTKEFVEESIENVRKDLIRRIPEFQAELGIRLQQALSQNHMDTVLQILIRPTLR